jgi:solute carrier family 13 (sodium-dependent dicarboxylate transporter), member 2/3/5
LAKRTPTNDDNRELLGNSSLQQWSFWIGVIALIYWLTMVPGVWESPSKRLLGLWVTTIWFWITEPIPLAISGLLAVGGSFLLGIPQQIPPLPNEPAKNSATVLKELFTPFGSPSVFFLMGGMFLGQAMARHGLDRRFALAVLCAPGMSRSIGTVLFSVGLAVTTLSMVISNTAATAIVLPVVLQILDILDQRAGSSIENRSVSSSRYGTALLLMTAYASSVGGISTPIGTTTNVVAISKFKNEYFVNQQVNFLNWATLGIPLMLILFVLLFLLLRWYGRSMRLDLPALQVRLLELQQQLGGWKRGEWNTLLIFILAMLGWLLPGVVGLFHREQGAILQNYLPEELVAMLIPVGLFLLPDRASRTTESEHYGTLHLSDFQKLDWSALLLFGAGLALGELVKGTGLAKEVAQQIASVGVFNLFWLIAFAAFAGILLSEFSSNVAAALILLPIFWDLSTELKFDPLGPMMAVTLASSFGSALPVSTPPNTLIYSSGRIPLTRMAIVGLAFDLVCWIVVTLGVYFAVGWNWKPWF